MTGSSEWHHHQRVSSTTHSKDDALNEREFELLYEGAAAMDGYQGLEAEFIVVVAGRLGLRLSEISHLQADWIDWRDDLIQIPAHEPCTKGRHGDHCGQCEQAIAQCVDYNDEVQREDVVDNWWRPKTQAAVRGVPFDWCPRADIQLERFFEEFDAFERSGSAIGRRVTSAAELAPGLDPDEIYPHCLRATAATLLSGKGLSAHALCSMFGWANLSTARVYLARSDQNTQRAVRSVHSQ